MIESLLLLFELSLFWLLLYAVGQKKSKGKPRTLGLFKYKNLKSDQVQGGLKKNKKHA